MSCWWGRGRTGSSVTDVYSHIRILWNEDIALCPLTSFPPISLTLPLSLTLVLVCPPFGSHYDPALPVFASFSDTSKSIFVPLFSRSWSQQGETGVKNNQSGHRLCQCQLHQGKSHSNSSGVQVCNNISCEESLQNMCVLKWCGFVMFFRVWMAQRPTSQLRALCQTLSLTSGGWTGNTM